MTDEAFWSEAKEQASRSRQPKAGEQLFGFRRELEHYVCELREYGEFGADTQL